MKHGKDMTKKRRGGLPVGQGAVKVLKKDPGKWSGAGIAGQSGGQLGQPVKTQAVTASRAEPRARQRAASVTPQGHREA